MNQPTGSFGERARRTITRLLIGLVVLALGGAVVVLLSQLNSQTFRIAVMDGRLVVMKGRMLPVGALPFRPGDPALTDAYAPIPLEGYSPGSILQQRFTERDELDRGLFDVLEELARPRMATDDPQTMERALYYIRRAERLAGLSEEQRRTLKGMQAEVSYYLARTKLDDARRQIMDALAQLRISADSQSRHARSASQMLLEIEPASRGLEEALRKAVHTLSAPVTQGSAEGASPARPAADAQPPGR